VIVLSPGVSMSLEPIQEAKNRGRMIISEIELAYNFIDAPSIAITGTNGKTTTTTLIGEILRRNHKEVFVGGNIGNPLINCVIDGRKTDYVVAEISSFQLEGIMNFRPKIVVFLNMSPDHLDRYSSYEDYVEAKKRIFVNQRDDDVAVLNADDPLVSNMAAPLGRTKKVYFSRKKKIENGVYLDGNHVISGIDQDVYCYETEGIKIKGCHNIENTMAAIAATETCMCSKEKIKEAVYGFSGLEHRMEFVEEISGVEYYNDSKATNVAAVEKSLESFDRPIILIAGGKDKGTGYETLKDLVMNKVKKLILIGEAKDIIQKSLGCLTTTTRADTLQDAVKNAHSESGLGDVVLFAPGCSSFDMFNNYEERGRAFKTAVRELKSMKD
ncbi:MAG: UDP-N-acetylmuramoyl-L-alanine--D-glutamate ligase, partial [Thermodesulfobacteriota bacterium]|nr:UDP-N-acetylmuramoyl-L-alanine--D-glutamate ligase [Thermodesulfobacteriota bacterium]